MSTQPVLQQESEAEMRRDKRIQENYEVSNNICCAARSERNAGHLTVCLRAHVCVCVMRRPQCPKLSLSPQFRFRLDLDLSHCHSIIIYHTVRGHNEPHSVLVPLCETEFCLYFFSCCILVITR